MEKKLSGVIPIAKELKIMAGEQETREKLSFWQKGWLMWLCLVFLPPVGMILCYLNRDRYPKWKIICGVFALWFVYILVQPNNKQQPPTNQTAQTQQIEQKTEQQKQEAPAKPVLTGEEADKANITEIAKNSVKSADYRDITITKIVDADRYNVVLFLNGHDNLTTNMVYTGYKMSCEEGFKGLYTSSMGGKINDVKISIYTGMVNTQTGAKSEDVIYMLAMTRARANQMHWENIASVDIEKAATEHYMHPALRRDLQSK